MNLSELITSRRTVHNYRREKVSDAVVEEALRLSLWAPNHRLTYPWAYFWTEGETRMKLADLAVELKGLKEPLSEAKKSGLRDQVLNPSHLILLALKRGDPKLEHEDYATLACGVQIASLFLWEKGLGSKWSTSGYFTGQRTYEILGVSPEDFRLEGALLVGVPVTPPPTATRPALAGILRKLT